MEKLSNRQSVAIIGAAIYWGVGAASLTGWFFAELEAINGGASFAPVEGFSISQCVIILFTVLFTLISKLFTSKKITNSLALFSGISNLAAMGCLLVFKVYPSPINEVFILAIQILRGIGTVGLMLLWALWFAR